MSGLQKTEKLDGADNYTLWEVNVRSEMIVNNVYEVIEDDYIIFNKLEIDSFKLRV